jgi:hypothetical protein
MKEDNHIFWVDPEVHSAQHEFLQLLIEERAEAKARRERIKEKIAGSLILSGILTLVGLIGAGFLDWIKVHLK